MTKEDIHFDLTSNDDLFEIKLLIDCNKRCDNKQFVKNKTYQNAKKFVFNKLNIISTHLVHFVHGIGPIVMELKQAEPQYIKNIDICKPDTQEECYSANILINIMKLMPVSRI